MEHSDRSAYCAIALSFIYYLARACSKKYVLGLATLYASSSGSAAFVYSLYTIVQLMSVLAVGRLVDRYGNKPMMVCGSLSLAAGAVLMACSTNIWMIAVGNMLLGTAHGQFLVASQMLVVAVKNPQEKSKLAGYVYFSNSLGGFVGGAAGGYLQSWNSQLGFLGAAAAALGLLATTLMLPNIKTARQRGSRLTTRKFLQDKRVLANILISAMVLFCTDVLDGYLTEYYRSIMMPEVTIGWIFSVYHISTCVIRPFLGVISKKMGLIRVLLISLLLGGISLAAIGLVTLAGAALIVMTVVGVTVGLMNPITLLTVSAVAPPDERARILSLRVVANAGTQTLSANLFGMIVAATGSYAPVFFLSGAIMVITTVLLRGHVKTDGPIQCDEAPAQLHDENTGPSPRNRCRQNP